VEPTEIIAGTERPKKARESVVRGKTNAERDSDRRKERNGQKCEVNKNKK
jgi:hypothetical protein